MQSILNGDYTEVSSRSRVMKRKLAIIQTASQKDGGISLAEICYQLKVSPPTGIKLMNELLDEGFMRVLGKKETNNGRKPLLYTLNNTNFYSLVVEISMKRVSVGIVDAFLNITKYKQKTDFILENTPSCLDAVEKFISECLLDFKVKPDLILGMGVGITGRVRCDVGQTYTFFNFLEVPFAEHFSERFKMPIFVNNDTRCIGIAEKSKGKAQKVSDAVVINLSRGLGTCFIINNSVVSGASGFAGELGHVQFEKNDKMCICGKSGCLGTEVGGNTLEENFIEKIKEGEKSLIDTGFNLREIRYDMILQAAIEGDQLSIKLIQSMGHKLGIALGNIINLLNPELFVIAGKFSKVGHIIIDAVKFGITQSALPASFRLSSIEISELGDKAVLKGAGVMVFEHFKLMKNQIESN
jgi:transcriptional regulator of PTS gene